jgi:hypothetical protein
MTAARDRAFEGGRGPDSQADSHSVGHRQPSANVSGSELSTLHLPRTSQDIGGRQIGGLQNRLRGAAEASWVGSIPIHPRHVSQQRQPPQTDPGQRHSHPFADRVVSPQSFLWK